MVSIIRNLNSDPPNLLIRLVLPIILLFSGCTGWKHNTGDTDKPGNGKIIYAGHVAIAGSGDYTQITVTNPWQKAENVAYRYAFIHHGTSTDTFPGDIEIIHTPVQRVICLSTTHLGFLGFIGELNSVVGVSGARYITDSLITAKIKAGLVSDVGYEENINFELIVKLQPDAVLAYGVSGSESGYLQKIRDLGIPVILIAEYLEENPLAKLEWAKVFGLLFDKYKMANEKFDAIAAHYNVLKLKTRDLQYKPAVLLGLPWHGVWYISGGDSYIAKLIDDAGGNYLWRDTGFKDSRPMGLETIYAKALKADYWLNTGTASTIGEIVSVDQRFENLKPVVNKTIYNNNKLVNSRGGNAYFEKGVVEPDVILADLIHILHAEILPSHKLRYYKKLD